LALRSQVAERTKKMETEVRRAEREYGRRLRELDGGFEVSTLVLLLQLRLRGTQGGKLMIGNWKLILEPRDQDFGSQQIIRQDWRAIGISTSNSIDCAIHLTSSLVLPSTSTSNVNNPISR
jgi:hypothetical protein